MKFVVFPFLILICFSASSQVLTRFEPTSDISGSNFGTAVDIYNNEILVSSVTNVQSPGKVYLFNTENGIVQTNVFYLLSALHSKETEKRMS